MSKRIKRKQSTLAAFGFIKNVKHRSTEMAIQMSLETVETLFECENCEKSFKSPQGLAFHAKIMHSIIPKEDRKTSEPPVMQSNEELISLSVKDVVKNLVNKIVRARAKSEAASKVADKKHHQYSAAFKAEAINACDNGANQRSIAESFNVTQSQISRWLKKRKTILEDTTSSHRKLYPKGRRSTKYLELYKALFKEFLAARSWGHIVNFSWLWSRARKLQLDIDPKVEVKDHVVVSLLKKKELRMMSKQRNKRKHKKEMEPSLKKWHATFREKCIRKRSEDPSYDPKPTCAKAKC